LKHIVRYDGYKNRVIFPERIASGVLPEFAGAIRQWTLRRPGDMLRLDFSNVIKAFANGMLGIIAITAELRLQGKNIEIHLPRLRTSREFFEATNWAHLLDSQIPKADHINKKHFVQQFTSFEELPVLIDKFMDIVMGHIEMPGDILSALEWSVNEICDNVINHSASAVGGFLQVIAYPKNDILAFTVADAGMGIMKSLKEGLPDLKNDIEAIEEAIKAGVTRNKEHGQGNGLAGTLRITTMTGGSLDIISGSGRLTITPDGNNHSLQENDRNFHGTCVSGQIGISKEFSISKALTFGAVPYAPYNIVDAKYELEEEEDALAIRMTDQNSGTGTRAAGVEMRLKVLNLIAAKPGYRLYIDWQDLPVIASSFADEFMGKLFLKLGEEEFGLIIKHLNLKPLVRQLIEKAISERTANDLGI
jgi:hypothetical protein